MAKKESLQKKIDKLDRLAKFYQSLLLAVLSGLVWSIYHLLEHNFNKINILSGIGLLIAVLLAIKIKSIGEDQDILIDELERIE